MTGNEANTLGERMERLEQSQEEMRAEMRRGFEELNRALLGGLDGQGGLLGRVLRVEDTGRDHEARIDKLEQSVRINRQWIDDRNAQWRLLLFLGGGNLVGLIGLAYAILRLAGG